MSNSYQRLKVLTAQQARTVGTVTSLNADGTSTVQLMGGAFINVLGQGVALNAKAYIENGRVISEAANLPYIEIEV